MLLAALLLLAPPPSIVVLGDSVARGAGDESGRGISGTLGAANHGINGARTRDVLRQLKRPATRAAVRQAEIVVLSIGGNDLFGDSIARLRSTLAPRLATYFVAERVVRVVKAIHRENPRARVVLLGLYNPYRAQWLDAEVARWDARIIARFAGDRRVTVVRIADLLDTRGAISPLDRYHPSAAGYRAVAERIAASCAR